MATQKQQEPLQPEWTVVPSNLPSTAAPPEVAEIKRFSSPVVDTSQSNQQEVRDLLASLVNMFPEAPIEYLEEEAEDLVGKPAAIDRFISEMLANNSNPPKYWRSRVQNLASESADATESMAIQQQPPQVHDKMAAALRKLPPEATPETSVIDGHSPPDDITQSNQQKVQDLVNSLVNIFPDAPIEYLEEQSEDLVGKPAAIDRFILEMVANNSNPPKYWRPRAQGMAKVSVECGCCFNDECVEEDMLFCSSGHMFCKECVQRASEVAVGEGKTQLMCLTECDKKFKLATLQKALKSVFFSKWLGKIQVAELEKADIKGLEQCPFCPFATIMDATPEQDKEFFCQNLDCGKVSCRLCHEISHIPKKCKVVEQDAEVKKRVYIENKMAEALIRNCWQCKKPFVKLDGCNRMTCQCGAIMCYLCRKSIAGYNHFYEGRAYTVGKCPLWSNDEEVHQREVAQTAIEAKKKMDTENPDVKLKHDPTTGIQLPPAKRRRYRY